MLRHSTCIAPSGAWAREGLELASWNTGMVHFRTIPSPPRRQTDQPANRFFLANIAGAAVVLLREVGDCAGYFSSLLIGGNGGSSGPRMSEPCLCLAITFFTLLGTSIFSQGLYYYTPGHAYVRT